MSGPVFSVSGSGIPLICGKVSTMRIAIFVLLFAFFVPVTALTDEAVPRWISSEVTVCPVTQSLEVMPSFTEPGCTTQHYAGLDPQGRVIWVRGSISLDEGFLQNAKPKGLYLSGKAASRAFVNNTPVGENGMPGLGRVAEVPGMMDDVIYLPRDLLRAGANDVTLLMSSHHGYVALSRPIHVIAIADYDPQARPFSPTYLFTLATLGVLVLGAVYFGLMAALSDRKTRPVLLTLVSIFAIGQLLAEVARAVWPYAYPLHDLRLILILVFSFGFGLCLAFYVVTTFVRQRQALVIGGITLVTLIIVGIAQGYDAKSAFAILVPVVASLVLTGLAALQKQRGAFGHFLVLVVFAVMIYLSPWIFLDMLFYYSVAGLLIYLFVQQAFSFLEERELRRSEAKRARQLSAALAQAEEAHNGQLSLAVKSSGKTDYVLVSDIICCNAAGDYVEIIRREGAPMLHHGTLGQLEEQLSGSFIRVHRSHLANTQFIQSLERLASGVGELTLASDIKVPVSRRIMPQVRKTLKAG